MSADPDTHTISVRVRAARWEAKGISSYELVAAGDGTLPPWAAGDHIDVHLPSGTIRQYSLCGDRSNTASYRIAILEIPQGRGGSVEAHLELRPGRVIEISRPRSNFALVAADDYLFIAGGIGITPLLPMIRQAHEHGSAWHLVYGARTSEHFAFVDEIAATGTGSVDLIAQDSDGHPDLAALVTAHPHASVYCCGPAPLMDLLTDHMRRARREDALHLERFTPAATVASESGRDTFEVTLARTGITVEVGPDSTILDAVRSAGVEHPSSCEMGFCGTCEAKVLDGQIEHRDDLLSESERAEGNSMMICVSRSACPRLTLDL